MMNNTVIDSKFILEDLVNSSTVKSFALKRCDYQTIWEVYIIFTKFYFAGILCKHQMLPTIYLEFYSLYTRSTAFKLSHIYSNFKVVNNADWPGLSESRFLFLCWVKSLYNFNWSNLYKWFSSYGLFILWKLEIRSICRL